jgi:hypothetical protein
VESSLVRLQMMQVRSKEGVFLPDIGRGIAGNSVAIMGGGAWLLGEGMPKLLRREW